MRTRTEGSVASARPMTTFCWLPPERLDTGWSGPSVTMPSEAMARLVSAALRRGAMKPSGPSRRPIGHGRVVGDRLR